MYKLVNFNSPTYLYKILYLRSFITYNIINLKSYTSDIPQHNLRRLEDFTLYCLKKVKLNYRKKAKVFKIEFNQNCFGKLLEFNTITNLC